MLKFASLIFAILLPVHTSPVDDQLVFQVNQSPMSNSSLTDSSSLDPIDPTYHDSTDFDNATAAASNFLRAPPRNNNWAIKDLSSKIRLGYGKIYDTGKPYIAGATYRNFAGMGNLDGSCAYWKKGILNFVDPGWNPYLVGVSAKFFGKSMQCGSCLLIYNPKNRRSIVSVITDYCPTCSSNQLDIAAAGSAFLAGGSPTNDQAYKGGPENFSGLEVRRVECDWKGSNVGYYFDTGSSRFNWYLIIYFKAAPVDQFAVEKVQGNGAVIPFRTRVSHDSYGRFVVQFPNGDATAGLYKVTMKSSLSNTSIVDYFRWNGKQRVRVNGTKRFPLSDRSHEVRQFPEA